MATMPALGDAFQLAYVTRDLDAAVAMFERDHGVRGFHRVTFEQDCILPGGPSCSHVALGWSGPHQIEIIQPVSGAVQIYSDALTGKDGPVVFHHLGIRIAGGMDEWDMFRAGLDRPGHPVVFEGAIGDDCRFAYVDERAGLGHYLEYIWLSSRFAQASGMDRA